MLDIILCTVLLDYDNNNVGCAPGDLAIRPFFVVLPEQETVLQNG